MADKLSLYNMAKRTGLNNKQFEYIFDNYIHTHHDSLWIDLTTNSPAYIRINGYDVLDIKEINMRIQCKDLGKQNKKLQN